MSRVGAQAVIFLGAPGAGKGTQAREVARCLGIPQISTGDILREAIAGKTPQGLAAKAKLEAGELVPDEVVCGMVEERISKPDCKEGFILDGFPRTLRQAEFVDQILKGRGWGSPHVLNLSVDEDLLVKRLAGRRVCPVGGELYNIYFSPPKRDGVCDRDGARLIQRPDDNEGPIRQRLATYASQTSAVIDYYRRSNLLHDVDGSQKPEVITQELCRYLTQA